MSAAPSPKAKGPPTGAAHEAHEILLLDAHTQEDLKLFGVDSNSISLFNFCNRCSTEGGEKVLRRRMEMPWSTAERIRATQEAISFIHAHRDTFSELPSRHVAKSVNAYTRGFMPVVTQLNPVTFTIGAFALKTNDDDFFIKIRRGVLFTRRLLRSLRQVVHRVQAAHVGGEMAPLVSEMQTLLDHPRLAQVPDDETGGFWKILRIDQTFRLHEREAISRLVELVHEVDALVAMADVTSQHGFVLPSIESGAVRVQADGLFHPFITNPVANMLELCQGRRLLFLTGPNMAGKTTYLRAAATALYLAHLGMGVPARTFRFVPIQRLLTSISMNDDLDSGVSYFRAEALRVKAVAQSVADGYRVVAVMDEPFKGTNVKDALDASLAILNRLATKENCLFLVSSHLIELRERFSDTLPVDFRYFEAEEQDDRLGFDYVVRSGVSSQRLGMRVLREEGIFDLLDGKQTEE
jgi:DNA mismatch repair protein MutS